MRRLIGILIISLALFGHVQGGSVKITGNRLFSEKDLSRFMDKGQNDNLSIARVESLYQQQGYFGATVKIDSINNAGNKNIVIDEGGASRIKRVSIELIPPDSSLNLGEIVNGFSGQIASETNLNSLADQCVAFMAENGMPFAGAQWRDFQFDSDGAVLASMRIVTGPRTHIKSVLYRGLKRSKVETLNRALSVQPGDLYRESDVRSSEKLIGQMPYLRVVSPFQVEPVADGDSCQVIYNVRELPSTMFDGAAGLTSVKGKSTFVGRANLLFGDILGTGRAFGLRWNRKDRFSSELQLTYLEPYVLNSSFELKLEAHQVDRDSLFIESGGSVGLAHEFGSGLGGSLNLAISRTVPETGSKVASSTGRAVGVQFDYSDIDRADNPTSGYAIITGLSHKSRTNQNADSLNLPSQISSAGVDLRYFARISRRFVTAFAITSWGVVSNDGQIPADELHYIGGFESLRGYAEKQIPAYRYAIATIEPRLITGPESRVYLFTDFGEIRNMQVRKYSFFPGYGIGFVAPTALGQFKLEVAWGKTGFPSDAILNFGLAGRF